MRYKEQLSAILAKADFWREHAADEFTANQRKMLNMLFDGFEGNLTSSKWAKICKVSQDTASREINALVARRILRQEGQGASGDLPLLRIIINRILTTKGEARYDGCRV